MQIRIATAAGLIALTFLLSETVSAQNVSCKATAYPSGGNVGGTGWSNDKKLAEWEAIAKCQKFNGGATSDVGKTCKVKESNCKPGK